MNINTFSATKAAEEVLTMAEKGILSAKVVLTGFVVVFAVLILLIILIAIYGKIITTVEKSAEKRKLKAEEKAKEDAPVVKPVATAPVVQSGGVPQEVVAVISAAVATMYGSTEKVRIKSIKKSNGGRSAWANAGVLNNTRPF